MAVFTSIIGAIGAATAAVGTAAGVVGSIQQASGQRKAQAAQRKQEALREKQMENDSRRKQLELVRQQQIARATSLASTTASGASAEGSSAMGGVEGTISGQYNRGIQADESNLGIGRLMFAEGRNVARGQAQAARGGTLQSAGQGLTSLGNAFVNNAERYGRIFGQA
jgi:hypothetical protein